MKLYVSSSLVILAFVLVLSCEETSKHELYFPNSVGDRWTYAVSDSITFLTRDTMTVTIVDEIRLVNGARAKIWVYKKHNYTDTTYVVNSGDSVKIYESYPSSSDDLLYPSTLYLTPFEIGKSWLNGCCIYDSYSITDTETVTVGTDVFAGCFTMVRNSQGPNYYFDEKLWFSTGVGFVAFHIYEFDLGISRYQTCELVDYHVK